MEVEEGPVSFSALFRRSTGLQRHLVVGSGTVSECEGESREDSTSGMMSHPNLRCYFSPGNSSGIRSLINPQGTFSQPWSCVILGFFFFFLYKLGDLCPLQTAKCQVRYVGTGHTLMGVWGSLLMHARWLRPKLRPFWKSPWL